MLLKVDSVCPNPEPERPRTSRLSARLLDGLTVLLLCGLVAKLTYGSSVLREVAATDETHYLIGATAIPTHGMPDPQYGPLYLFWYLTLARLPIDLLYVTHVNWVCLVGLLTITFFLLLRALGASRPWALFVATLMLSSGIVEVMPLPLHLAAGVLMLGTAVAVLFRSLLTTVTLLGLTLLTVTYIRPEYGLSLILYGVFALGLTAWLWMRQPELRRRLLGSTAILTVATAVFVSLFGFPLSNGARSFIAFGQHYSLNLHEAGLRTGNPWHEWEAAVQADFGKVHSFGAALRSNPQAVLWHVQRNLNTLPAHLFAMLAVHLDLSPRGQIALTVGMRGALLLGLFGLIWRFRRNCWNASANRPVGITLLLTVFLAIPAVMQVLLIFPRQHYLLPLTLFSLAVITASVPMLATRGWAARLTGRGAFLAVAMLMALLVPNRVHGWNAQQAFGWRVAPEIPAQDITSTVELLRQSGVSGGPIVVLEHQYYGWVRSFYIAQPHRLLFHPEKREGFATFLQKHDVGVVLLSPALADDPSYDSDPEFHEFLQTNGGEQYTILESSRSLTRVAVRKDLLDDVRSALAVRQP